MKLENPPIPSKPTKRMPKKTGKKHKKKPLRGLTLLVFIIFVIAVGGTGYYLMKEIKKELSIVDMEKELDKFVEVTPTETPEEPPAEKTPDTENVEDNTYVFDWNGLLNTNAEVVGWIRFENPARINYPIVQGNDNQKYLSRDWRDRYQPAGAIFLNKGNNPAFEDTNSVIYGHRMINGSMFGSLKRFSSQSYMDNNPYFYIYTPDGQKRTYEAFAFSQVTDGTDVYSTQFETDTEKKEYFQKMKLYATTSRDVTLDESDTIVTLSTCANSGYYERIVVQGKLLNIEQNQTP